MKETAMNATHPRPAAETVRKAAVAAYEALPAILLAAALLMPALAAFAAQVAEQAAPERVELSQAIATQGNQALVQIRQESRESLRASLTLPSL